MAAAPLAGDTGRPMNDPHFSPIGTPGQAWGQAELAQWRSRQVRQRSYADDVLTAVERLRDQMDVQVYGEVVYAGESFPPGHPAQPGVERSPAQRASHRWRTRL